MKFLNFVLFGLLILLIIFLIININFKNNKSEDTFLIIGKNKYSNEGFVTKINSLDAKNKVDKLKKELTDIVNRLQECQDDDINDCIQRLRKRFDSNNIFGMKNADNGDVAYIKDKKLIYICVSNDTDDKLKYVALHELAHCGNDEIGHGYKFKKFFNYLTEYALQNDYISHDYANDEKFKFCDISYE